MKKDEYLNILSQGLKQYDQAYVREILDDYEEHFQDALAQGQREEDICLELGDPNDLIREIREMMDVPAGTHEVGRPVIELEKENCKSEKFQKKAYKGRQYQEQKSSGAQNFSHPLKKVRFYAESADIRLIPSADGEFYVYTEDADEMDYLEHNCHEDTYEGRVRRSSGSFFGIDIFRSFIGSPVDTVIMVIPEGIEDIRIETISGDISAEDIQSELLSFTSVSGDISLRGIQNQGTFINTKSGDIRIHHLSSQHCDIKALSGDVSCKDSALDKLVCNSISGEVNYNRLSIQKEGLIKTISGEIAVKLTPGSKPFCAFATSVSGRIRIRDGIRMDSHDFRQASGADYTKLTLNSISGEILVKQAKDKEKKNK